MFVPEFDLRSFLCSESEQLIWKSQGLPSDDLSMENALVILQVSMSISDDLSALLLISPNFNQLRSDMHCLHFKKSTSKYIITAVFICNSVSPS